MLGINARVEDLKLQIITDINKAKLPISLVDYILQDLSSDIHKQNINAVQKERQAEKASQKQEVIETNETD